MCLFRPLNIVLGVIGLGLLGIGAVMFFICLPTGVGIPNALDVILLATGAFLIALHLGILCCESTNCCLCIYKVLTAVMAACELVFTVLFFIPAIQEEIINETEHIVQNATSDNSEVCNITGLVGDVSTTGDTMLYFAIVMLALMTLQFFLIMAAGCHGDALHNEKFDQIEESNRQAFIERRKATSENQRTRVYKEKHKAIFDKYSKGRPKSKSRTNNV